MGTISSRQCLTEVSISSESITETRNDEENVDSSHEENSAVEDNANASNEENSAVEDISHASNEENSASDEKTNASNENLENVNSVDENRDGDCSERAQSFESDDEGDERRFDEDYASESPFEAILNTLIKASDDVSAQVNALVELCNQLIMSTEENLDFFQEDCFVPLLVTMLNRDCFPEMMLYSARALAYLCDVLPEETSFVVNSGAIPAFCKHLLNIEYIDVAEECLQALQKLSISHGADCLRDGALLAVLQHIDFFSDATKRIALSTAVNMCNGLSSQTIGFAIDAVPILAMSLKDQNPQVVENASKCLSRIVDFAVTSPKHLRKLSSFPIVSGAANLIFSTNTNSIQPSAGSSTYTVLIKLLSTCASISSQSTKELLEMRISAIIRDVLLGLPVDRSANQIYDTVMFANKLLPSLEGRFSSIHDLNDEPADLKTKDTTQQSEVTENTIELGPEVTEHERMLHENPGLLLLFGMDLLPTLIQLCEDSASLQVKQEAMVVIKKLLWFCPADILKSLLSSTNFFSFLYRVLNVKHVQMLNSGLEMSEMLLQKFPETIPEIFVKEGIFSAIIDIILVGITENPKFDRNEADESKGDASNEGSSSYRNIGKVGNYAMRLKETFFSKYLSSSDAGATENISDLEKLCCELNNELNRQDAKSGPVYRILEELLLQIEKEEGISTFEFVRSGVVECLLNYFHNGNMGEELYKKNSKEYVTKLIKRIQHFVLLSLPLSSQGKEAAFTILVRKLQDALASFENFEVVLTHIDGFPYDARSFSKMHYSFMKPIQLLLLKAPEEKGLLGYPSTRLTMKISNSVADLENVVWSKVQKNEGPAGQNDDAANSLSHLNFFLGGKQLRRSSSLYNSILESLTDKHTKRLLGSNIAWRNMQSILDIEHLITYKKAETSSVLKTTKKNEITLSVGDLLHSIIPQRRLPCALNKTDPTYDMLVLLKILEGLNHCVPWLKRIERANLFAEGILQNLDGRELCVTCISQEEFVNKKLTSKIIRQMQDFPALCTKSLPCWWQDLINTCPFLFPFEIRRKYFLSTSLGSSFAFQHLLQQMNTENPTIVGNYCRNFGGLNLRKVSISRKNMLDSAAKVMEFCSNKDTLLEVEFESELGTGSGPTVEFYTLVSHEFQKSEYGMWRNPSQGDNTVDYLFPRPYLCNGKKSSNFEKVKRHFSLLGRITAKALQEGRLLDLPLSLPFYKLVLGQRLNIADIDLIDPELGSVLSDLQAIGKRKKHLDSSPSPATASGTGLRYRDAEIKDLCINFTLPGYSDFPLKQGGEDIYLDLTNIGEYVDLVIAATTYTGVLQQIESFKKGFDGVLPVSSLKIFVPNELDTLFCGSCDLWKTETLEDYIKFEHGYTAQSPQIANLLEIMGEFSPSQQRSFLQFVTGCPRLPAEGLASLNPKLTVVKKITSSADNVSADADLPSAMTCANYLKLPPYSTKEIMHAKLLYAITEGQGSFHLS